jgi:glycosyltransferase involved in cell wall biosynthesis
MDVDSPSLRVALMLETDGPGGAENVVFHLAEALRDRGHTVYPVGRERGDGWLGEKLRASGFEAQTFDQERMFDWRLIRHLKHLFEKLDVDVVHCHEFVASVYGGIAARLVGRPHVFTMHGNQTMCDAWRRRAALRWVFRRSNAVVAVSQSTKAQLDRDLGIAPELIRVIRNGVPVRMGQGDGIRREFGVREDETLILAVGNLLERKGHIYLLRALQRLVEQGLPVPWRLAIAGGRSGDERPKLDAFIAEHGLSDRVDILSHRNDVPDLLAAADLFVMPSLWEGLPLSVLEAMLMGVAVIASETSGIPEAIANEKHGLLVPPGDVERLSEALGRLLRDPELRAKLASGGRTRALAEFTIDAMADAYEALYRTAGSSRP